MGEDRPLFKTALVIIISFFMAGLIPFFGLFLFGGVESELLKSTMYYAIGALSLLALLAMGIINKMVNDGQISEEKWGWVNVLIFEPASSMFADTPLEKYLTFSNIMHFSIIFALSMALIGTLTQTFFVALPAAEFQITETGQLILATEPAASTETLLMTVIMSLTIGIIDWFIKRKGLPTLTRIVFMIIGSFINMGVWVGLHFVRYGVQETSLIGTGLFGFLGSLISFMTGSPLTWYIWHFFNNLFLKAKNIFGSDTVVIVMIVIILVYTAYVVMSKVVKSLRK